MTVPRRRIGTAGPEVSVLSLGSWHIYDRMPFRDAVAMLRHAVDQGITLFDVGYYGGFSVDGKPGQESYTDILFGRIIQAAGVARDDYQLSAKLVGAAGLAVESPMVWVSVDREPAKGEAISAPSPDRR